MAVMRQYKTWLKILKRGKKIATFTEKKGQLRLMEEKKYKKNKTLSACCVNAIVINASQLM